MTFSLDTQRYYTHYRSVIMKLILIYHAILDAGDDLTIVYIRSRAPPQQGYLSNFLNNCRFNKDFLIGCRLYGYETVEHSGNHSTIYYIPEVSIDFDYIIERFKA